MMARGESIRGACKEFEQDLVLYYYGECEADEKSRVQRHLEGCASCRHFFDDLGRLLPMTVKPDDPPLAFWENYSRELRSKLQAAEQMEPWWKGWVARLRPWPVPALATALILILALSLTFTKRAWRPQETLSEEEVVLEILPMAENLEFFRSMELLDSLDLLESLGGLGNASA